MSSAALNFAVISPALFAAHQLGDLWLQSNFQALNKHRHDNTGRIACAGHVLTYTLATFGAVLLVWAVLDLSLSWTGVLAGQLISAITHYFADRRFTLKALATRLGKSGLYELGAPRPGTDDRPSLGTGAHALDQSWHFIWLFIAALITSVL